MRKTIETLLESNLTASAIAKGSGVPYSTIHDLKSGKRELDKLSLLNAEKLANYFEEENKMNTYNVRDTWNVTEQEFDFDLHKFFIEGATDPRHHGWIYPDDLKQQDQLRAELESGEIDLDEWPVEWYAMHIPGYPR